MSVEKFQAQANKSCTYAKVLKFLESEAGKKNCFQLIETREVEETIELRARINDLDITIHNGKKGGLPCGFANRAEIGLGKDAFSMDGAKERLVKELFRWYGLDSECEADFVAVTYELQGWPAFTQLGKFLPGAVVDVIDAGAAMGSVNVTLGKKTLAKAKAGSVHEAKHQAACQVFNDAHYRTLYALSGSGRSLGYIRAELACQDQSGYKNMCSILKKNHLAHAGKQVYAFDESTDMVYAQFELEKAGSTPDLAAKRVHSMLTNICTNGKSKKQMAAERDQELKMQLRLKRSKFLAGHPTSVLTGLAKKLELEVECSFNDEKSAEDLHQCVIGCDDMECKAKDTSKKLAKAAAADQMIKRVIKKNPMWYDGVTGIPEKVSVEEIAT